MSDQQSRRQGQAWRRVMVPRLTDEAHRVATPLELFFDLCFVVAVAQAANALHHDLSHDHISHGLIGYLAVFFAIWWAWMNFTWFASGYDTDDIVYRLTTLVLIAGALVLAAGVPRAFDDGDYAVVVAGYVIMRMAMVVHLLRAAHGHPEHRRGSLRSAVGITVLQVFWVARLWLPEGWIDVALLVLVAAELAVPLWAERAGQTPWHPRHIAERFGLFTIIVLGESVLSATFAVQAALDAGHGTVRLVGLAAAGLVVVAAMWWVYFDRPAHVLLTSLRTAFRWGYGHYLILASAAAVGAGIAVAVDVETGAAHLPALVAGYTIAVPVAAYLAAVWALHVLPHQRGPAVAAFPVAAGLVLLTPFTPVPLPLTAAVLVALVAVTELEPA